MVPTSTGKPGNMRVHYPVREKLGNFEHTGKVREFYPNYWKSEEILASAYIYVFTHFELKFIC